ncbi:hypothetical protein [Yoonia sp. SS1-5]|uniref:Uncharacterized protein n=1 Tax=Yoonia rhodophyticola TaxID=3137370 RepID=A0AAN0NJS4_9RHOB
MWLVPGQAWDAGWRMHGDDQHTLTPPPWRVALPRTVLRIILVAGAAYLIMWGFDLVMDRIRMLDDPAANRAATQVLIAAVIGYAILIAIPFVPGIEIGIALLLMKGAAIAPFVYLATVVGLSAAFVVGQTLSLDWLHKVFADLHMLRACRLLDGIKRHSTQERLAMLTDRLPRWLARPLVQYRYVTIGLLINMPGTSLIGGGGGILMLAGVTRLFHSLWMFAVIALATLPVPLAVWLFGSDVLG